MSKRNPSNETEGALDYVMGSPDGFEEAKEASEKMPSFPVFVFFVALIKDSVDIMFFGTIGVIIAPFAWLIITFWLFGKGNFLVKFLVKRRLEKRAKTAVAIELIPGLSIVPVFTIMVVMAHFAETKFVKELEYLIVQVETGRAISFDKIKQIAQA